ncbi:hypothetical protein [Rhodococcus sp. MS16]|nr:hypothetical protein [Rhodococcus sp. MS16]
MTASKSTAIPAYVSPRAAMSTAEIKARIAMMFSDDPAFVPDESGTRTWA